MDLAKPPVVVLGLSPTGLHCIRSLAQFGAEVWGVGDRWQAGARTRFLTGLIADGEDSELVAALLARADVWRTAGRPKPVLIASSDQHVEFITRNHAELEEHFAFQASYADGLADRIMAKDSFAEICEQNGVALPQTLETTRENLLTDGQKLPFPCMIKPAQIHRVKEAMRGTKGWTATSPEQLPAIAREVPEGAGTLLVQEIVPGPESNITLACSYFDRNSEPHHMFTARKLRQFPRGFGSASLVQSCEEEETAAITKRLLTAIGYHGIAASEFKRDPASGALKIIEVNVRPSLWFSLSEASGRPVVLSAYCDLAGLPLPPERKQEHGVRWRYRTKDLVSALGYRLAASGILPSPDVASVGAATRTVSPVFSIRDPGPSLAEGINFVQKALRRLFRNRAKDTT